MICPYGTFQAKDGPVNVATATQEMWVTLCQVLGLEELIADPDYVDNSARMAHREALKRRLNERFTARTQIEWIEKLMAAGIPAGPIYTLDQVFADPQVQHGRLVEEVAHPLLGSIRQLSNPIRLDALEGRTVRQPPPLLGEHTEAVLKDFGFSAERIAGLLAREVVKLGPRESR